MEVTRYSVEPKTWKYFKRYVILSFAGNLIDKCGKKLIATATKTGLDAEKTVLKK